MGPQADVGWHGNRPLSDCLARARQAGFGTNAGETMVASGTQRGARLTRTDNPEGHSSSVHSLENSRFFRFFGRFSRRNRLMPCEHRWVRTITHLTTHHRYASIVSPEVCHGSR